MFKALGNFGACYLKDLLPLPRNKGKGLHSNNDSLLLDDPLMHRAACGDRSFSAAGSREWNRLPLVVMHFPTITTFISSLKIDLYRIAYEC